jgi:hypothetical protein
MNSSLINVLVKHDTNLKFLLGKYPIVKSSFLYTWVKVASSKHNFAKLIILLFSNYDIFNIEFRDRDREFIFFVLTIWGNQRYRVW